METHIMHTEPWIILYIGRNHGIDRQSWQADIFVGSLACESTQLVNGWILYLPEQSIECNVRWQGKEGQRVQGKVWLRIPAVTGLS